MKPLSVGNVVSAGLRIYRDNFKKYYRLALISSLWSWIPVYGWAKYYAYQALIARLAYGEIIEKPESVQDANRFVKGRMWSFLGAALLVGLRFLLAYIVGVVAIVIVAALLTTAIVGGLSAVLGDSGSMIGLIISILIYIAVFVLFFGYLIRLFASFSVSELLLSLKESINASQSLQKSKELTKGYLTNLLLIYIVASLVSFPLLGAIFAIQIVPEFIKDSYPIVSGVPFKIFQAAFNTVTLALILPFWQSIKAVTYLDLKVRREGMGLDLRK